ncbi:MAG: HD-GYP domain-containing protein, partial [Spirochaetaceae bacterium]|nr:HD-GYP domain-containing protein [Spirochaetaceae bacterium]
MKKFSIKGIPPGSFFSEPVYLDNQFVLAAPEMPFTRELAKTILDWEFTEVVSAGEPREEYFSEYVDGGANAVETADWTSLSDSDQIKRAEEFYHAFLGYVENLFTQVSGKKEIQ